MNTIYILFIILILMGFSLYKYNLTLTKKKENFDSKRTCMYQGYPPSFCKKAPLETRGPCYCPSGLRPYTRYSRCYCQTYL